MKLSKKGVLKAGILVFLVVMLLFFIVNGFFGFALTPEEEKQQLEAELAQLEQQLNVISAGLGQDFGGLLCGVDKIKYNNYNCDNLTAFHIVKVLTVGVHNQRFVDDSSVFDEVVRMNLRISEIKNRLGKLQ